MKKTALRVLLTTALAFVLPTTYAQDYPSRAVKIVVPFPPGALTDTMARLLAARLQEKWSQTVIVENRAGASGNIGMESVFRSKPDGYTLMFSPQSPLVLTKLLNPSLSFDPDLLVPISMVTRSTVVLLANPKVPAKNVKELIEYASANPGRLNYGSSGFAGVAHLSNELLNQMGHIEGVTVPYQGIAPATTALLGGEVDILFDAMGNSLSNIRSGKLRILAIANAERSSVMPEVPTVAETLPGFSASLWTGLVAPPGTPEKLATQISQAVAESLKHPELARRLASMDGLQAVGSTPQAMKKEMQEERERWSKVIKTTGIKAE